MWPNDLKRHRRAKHQNILMNEQQQQEEDFSSFLSFNNERTKNHGHAYQHPTLHLQTTKQQQEQQQQEQSFVFKHPFTVTVSGRTSCGKTHFVKMLLQNSLKMISPHPERIVWLYKRWQPLYDDMRRTVHP
jgi:transcriptional regulator of acetoin/glycerol metabolism